MSKEVNLSTFPKEEDASNITSYLEDIGLWCREFKTILQEKMSFALKCEEIWKNRYLENGGEWRNNLASEWRLLHYQLKEILGIE